MPEARCGLLARGWVAAGFAGWRAAACLALACSWRKSDSVGLESFILQPALSVQGSHAARAGTGDGLPIDVVLDVTRGKDTRYGCHGGQALQAAARGDVAVFHGNLAFEDGRVGLMADGNKDASDGEIFGFPGLCVHKACAGDAGIVAQHVLQLVEQLQPHIAVIDLLHHFVDQDGLGAELVATMHQGDRTANVGQVQGFFDGCVAATHHDRVLVFIEEAVAGGTCGYPAAHESLLGFEAQVLGRCPGGDNQGIAGIGVACVAIEDKRALGEINAGNVVEHHFGVKSLGVLHKALHEVWALDAGDVGRPVVHLGGGHQLAALLEASNQNWRQVGAGCVHCGSVTSRTRAQNHHFGVLYIRHHRKSVHDQPRNYNGQMARIPVSTPRSTRNVRNGPSALQTRLSSLLREARWILLAAVAAWLILVLATWQRADPGWSHSVYTGVTHNWGGTFGAYVADLLLYLFGASAWLWVLLMLRHVVAGFYRLTRIVLPTRVPELLPRVRWEVGIGFTLLFLGCMGIESLRLQSWGVTLPAGAGGQLGHLLAAGLAQVAGQAGGTLLLLAFIIVGSSLFFGFSWLNVSERVGLGIELFFRRLLDWKNALQDRRAGKTATAERQEIVETRQTQLVHEQPVRIEPTVKTVPISPRVQQEKQQALFTAKEDPALAGSLPALSLLDPVEQAQESVSPETIEFTSRLIEKKLSDFGVTVTVVSAQSGPVITRYEIEPAVGVKGSQIVNLAKDLARALSLVRIRVVETIPGKNLMGLELPNPRRQMVRLTEILGSQVYHSSGSLLTMALGKDIAGNPVVADLGKMPHLLVAGTTGSGKSVGINAMILSLLYKADASQVRLILIDPKMLEMSVYEGIPHLLAPVVTDMRHAANALNWCVAEMEKRYKLMSKLGVRNLAGFNAKIRDAQKKDEPIPNPFSLTPDAPEPLGTLPMIVVVIDELADLMMVVGKKVEELIARLAQKARAAGIHLILATQRPSVDVITGLIKANIPTRIAFQVSSKIDSRTILDQMGAETLLGQGDMLYQPPGTSVPTRVHGAFVHDDEVHRVVESLKESGEPDYVEGLLEGTLEGETGDGVSSVTGFTDQENDPLYDQAVEVVMRSRRASISFVQRNLRIGYNRSARILEQMERAGLVSPQQPNGNRDLLVPAKSGEDE